MKTFLVNLDKNPERLAASKAQLDKLGVEFERVRAVYGKDLTDDEKRRAVNRFRWWCAKGYQPRDGEIGVAMSQNGIYQRIVNEAIDVACVFEDDVKFSPRLVEVLEVVSKFVDSAKPQVVLLTNFTKDKSVPELPEIKAIEADQCAAGYVITRPAARAILQANEPIQVPCDNWSRWRKRGIIELYHALPTVCGQEDRVTFGSDIEVGTVVRTKEMSAVRLLAFKLKRVVGTIIDRSLPL